MTRDVSKTRKYLTGRGLDLDLPLPFEQKEDLDSLGLDFARLPFEQN